MKKFILIYITFSIVMAIAIFNKPSLVLNYDSKCEVSDSLSVERKDFEVTYSTYTSGNKKAILLMPPTGGKNIIDEAYAYNFCRKGYDVFIAENWTDRDKFDLDLSIHQKYMTKAQNAVSLILSKMKYKTIGAMGTSAGGIILNVSLGLPRTADKIEAFFGIVNGGPLCKVIANAGEKALRKVREQRFEKYNFKNMAEYEKKICSVVSWDTAKARPDHIEVGMVIAKKDKTVLTKFQMNSARELQADPAIVIDGSHFVTIVSTYLLHKNKVLAFFDKNL